jgi:peptidoglycan/xylan/chitin deacetylase (PgdA/CDA1 family)
MELRGKVAVELWRRDPQLVRYMGLGGLNDCGPSGRILRATLLALRASPRLLARVGLILPCARCVRRWFRFLYDYAFWYGVKPALGDRDLWKRMQGGTLILMYHAFGRRGEAASRYVVPGRRFARQMALLKRLRYNVISLSDYLAYHRECRFPPRRSVVITMDDGYADNVDVARPVLRRHRLPATIFTVTSGESRNTWSRDAPELFHRALIDLSTLPEVARDTFEFGAHTRTHPRLTELSSEEATDQIDGSKRDLELALGRTVGSFAYPHGAADADTRRAVERAGFAAACGVRAGRNKLATNSFELHRLEVRGTYTLGRFALTLLVGDTRQAARRIRHLPYGAARRTSRMLRRLGRRRR